MKAGRLYGRWRVSLEAKLDNVRSLLRKRRELDEAEVHDLRVGLRRARLLAALGARTLGKHGAKQFRNAAHAMIKAADRVRDCDIAMDWLATVGASESLARRIRKRRTQLWSAAKPQLRARMIGEIELGKGEKAETRKLVLRLDKHTQAAAHQCQKTVRRAPEISIEELHDLRRVVRRWRYIRELQLATRRIRRDRCLKTLIEVQESLGALQDTEVILGQLSPLGRTHELHLLRATLQRDFAHQQKEALEQIKRLPLRN